MGKLTIKAFDFSISIKGNKISQISRLGVTTGELIQIKGGNGSGKTSFLQACAGIIPHITGGKVSGSLEILGTPLPLATTDSLRSKVIYVPSAIDMFFACSTPFEELAFTIAGRKDSGNLTKIHELARESIDKFGMTEFGFEQIAKLSYGQRALCAIACAISSGAQLILLDEVMSSLDLATRKVIQKHIDSYIGDEGTCIVADHDFVWNNAREVDFTNMKMNAHKRAAEAEIDLTQWTHKDGTLIALTGENGSGKTTLLRHFAGFVEYEDLHEENQKHAAKISQISNKETASISYLPQESRRVFRYQTLDKELQHLGKSKPTLGDTIDVSDIYEPDISRLSYGQQKVAALCLIMTRKAKLILLDEPTRGLDKQTKQQVIEYLSKFSHRNCVTIVLATHDKDLIDACDLVLASADNLKTLEGAI